MSITRLPEIVFPITQVNKVNEIVDVLNENLNMYYSATNHILTPVEGVATWTITHNLGTENINCSLFNGDNLVISNVSIVSENVVTVSFNSSVNIPAETYKIVIISNGAGSSSGSGSYVLPTASTTTLGGVRIDGSTIKINNGVISSTVDSTLSDTSTNPVQNKVLYPSLSEFLPSGTTITVKANGTEDFTQLSDALESLVGKWSNGVVTIVIDGATTDSQLIDVDRLDIPLLEIKGINSGSITVAFSTGTYLTIKNQKMVIHDISLTNTSISASQLYAGIVAMYGSSVRITDCTFTGCHICAQASGSMDLNGAITINTTLVAIYAKVGGHLTYTAGALKSNCTWLLQAYIGSWICINEGVTLNFTGSRKSLVPNGTVNNNGYTRYPAAWDE